MSDYSGALPPGHVAIYRHIAGIQAELAFILNLTRLKEEVEAFPAEEVTSRVTESWAHIRTHLNEALLIAEREGRNETTGE